MSDYISAKDIYRVYADGVRALKYPINGWVQLQKPVAFQGCKPEENEKSPLRVIQSTAPHCALTTHTHVQLPPT